jgi:hypothetical protein
VLGTHLRYQADYEQHNHQKCHQPTTLTLLCDHLIKQLTIAPTNHLTCPGNFLRLLQLLNKAGYSNTRINDEMMRIREAQQLLARDRVDEEAATAPAAEVTHNPHLHCLLLVHKCLSGLLMHQLTFASASGSVRDKSHTLTGDEHPELRAVMRIQTHATAARYHVQHPTAAAAWLAASTAMKNTVRLGAVCVYGAEACKRIASRSAV